MKSGGTENRRGAPQGGQKRKGLDAGPVRPGAGIRDAIPEIGADKVMKALGSGERRIKPKRRHYDRLKIDGLWTYAGKKRGKARLIYACLREGGGIAAYA
ncbi:MAG: hypothetical protein LBF60_08515 [Treponema sp.]|nr:hypothetical protein [Treponema sp.]